jgi:hypothetical protein
MKAPDRPDWPGLASADPGGVGAEQSPGLEHVSVLIDDASGESLFVEVDADVSHGSSPGQGELDR